MARTRSFSIYLLKPNVQPATALEPGHNLDPETGATQLPPGSLVFILDSHPREPWWKAFFGIPRQLSQVGKGAIVFVPASNRWFALCFGHVSHNLDPEAYEHDFGLKITLNSVDPNALRSTDLFEPGTSRRRRVQIPTAADLTLFDVDADSTILKSLTGKVKPSREHLFRHVTGATNLRISAKLDADGLTQLCTDLLAVYNSLEYRDVFPEIQSVTPVSDPVVIGQLNRELVESIKNRADDVSISLPAIVDFNESLLFTFTGAGQGSLYDGLEIDNFYDYLEERKVDSDSLDFEELKKFRLVMVNEDQAERLPFRLTRSLIYDTKLGGDKAVYHLTDGNWYRFEDDYVAKLKAYLDPLFVTDASLIAYNHASEGDYNEAAALAIADTVCLDKTNISPTGQTQIEPCDIYSLDGGQALLRHVKISTRSSQLSHLFSQGTTSIELLKLEPAASAKLTALVSAKAGPFGPALCAPIAASNYAVRYCIITTKPAAGQSDNLPLFSRMNLMRAAKYLKLMGIDRSVCFVPDGSPPKPKKKPTRKKEAGAQA